MLQNSLLLLLFLCYKDDSALEIWPALNGRLLISAFGYHHGHAEIPGKSTRSSRTKLGSGEPNFRGAANPFHVFVCSSQELSYLFSSCEVQTKIRSGFTASLKLESLPSTVASFCQHSPKNCIERPLVVSLKLEANYILMMTRSH